MRTASRAMGAGFDPAPLPGPRANRFGARAILAVGLAGLLAIGVAAATFGPSMLWGFHKRIGSAGIHSPPMVALPSGAITYRPPGNFLAPDKVLDAPAVTVTIPDSLSIMVRQVSQREYQNCVAAAACAPLDSVASPAADYPAIGVSFDDATAYAAWLSAETGETWRLPTDAEWAKAAGSRYRDPPPINADSFVDQWLARYDADARRQSESDPVPRPFGGFGRNEHGLDDMAGNVWEWTSTCFERRVLEPGSQRFGKPFVSCGVRVVQGAHRAMISKFIRDPKSGGCSAGAPPSNLGIRLIRENAG
jgi:formylglycine-generating enzyme required for sulfatase activity